MPNCRDRGLSTARAVLSVLSYIAESQRGVSAREVADRLHKSLSTAYHLLASLEAEGFITHVGRGGCYELAAGRPGPSVRTPAMPDAVPPDAVPPDVQRVLQSGMHRIFSITGRRTCIGVFSADGVTLVQDIGRQGLPRMGNLEKPLIRTTAHALAVGKLLLAEFDEDGLTGWVAQHGLRGFTPSTIVEPLELRRELADVRRRGVAVDRGEYDADFGSLAVPVIDADGRAVAAIAITVTHHQFAADHDKLQLALLGVTRELGEARVG